MTVALDPGTGSLALRPPAPPGPGRTAAEVAKRALRTFFRTPGLWAMGIVQSGGFLFAFRFVFGGAVHAGATRYVEYLVPGYAATIVLFTGGGVAVAVAEDRAGGFTDRLLSLPVPRWAVVAGRALADSVVNAWVIAVTVALGFAYGFRLDGGAADALGALGLCLLYGVVFSVVFMVIGLVAANAQAAQGLSMVAFVLAFFSSTYVPVASMPGWLAAFARVQPVTPMVDAVRAVLAGSGSDVGLALLWSAALVALCAPVAVARYRRG